MAVVEAGLGGARDATNVFEPAQVQAAVITAIDLEHMDALGAFAAAVVRFAAGGVVGGHVVPGAAQQIFCLRNPADAGLTVGEHTGGLTEEQTPCNGACGRAGGSLVSIAEAKAGIMKEGRPVVLGRQPHARVKEILCSRAAKLKCRWANE